MNELQSQLTAALLVPYVLQYLKGAKWFPLGFDTQALNRIVSAIVAAAAGFGVAFHFNSDVGSLTVTGLTAAGLWQGGLHMIQQYLMQHAAYKTLIAPSLPGTVQDQIRRGLIPQALDHGIVPAVAPLPPPPPPPQTFVGDQIGAGSALYSVLAGDPAAVGGTVTEARGRFVKRTDELYEKVG